MNSFLSESLTVGLFLVLIFGTVCFYLYSRISYTEKRLSLIENMLLDLRMSMDAGHSENEYVPEPVSPPTPLGNMEGEVLPTEEGMTVAAVVAQEETLYKNILNEMRDGEEVEVDNESSSQDASQEQQSSPVKVMPNYEAMLKDELVTLCGKRGIKVSGNKRRAELISLLRKYDEQQSKGGEEEKEIAGSLNTGDIFPLAATLGDSGEGFSVDLGNAEALE